MTDTIIIKQKYTACTVTTSVKMPGKSPISKKWRRGGKVTAVDEAWGALPSEVMAAADDLHTEVCDTLFVYKPRKLAT